MTLSPEHSTVQYEIANVHINVKYSIARYQNGKEVFGEHVFYVENEPIIINTSYGRLYVDKTNMVLLEKNDTIIIKVDFMFGGTAITMDKDSRKGIHLVTTKSNPIIHISVKKMPLTNDLTKAPEVLEDYISAHHFGSKAFRAKVIEKLQYVARSDPYSFR